MNSLGQYVPPRTDFDGVEHENAYTGGRWEVLVIGTDERYLPMGDDRLFSTGNHGAMINLADSDDVGSILRWTLDSDRFVITLCHGPAALVAAARGRDTSPFAGYRTCVFPDALDTGANVDIGYIPGPMPWLAAARLRELGVDVANDDMAGQVLRDRQLLTGDSPLAANELGKLAAATLLDRTRSQA